MIFDRTARWRQYVSGQPWQTAFDFLLSLDCDAAEKQHELRGDDMYAVVESYDTMPPKDKLAEAHRKYIDIQMLLSGREQIAWAPTCDLNVAKPYLPQKDIEFYARSTPMNTVLELVPGLFAVFYPGDAHMPGLHARDTGERVKKVVVKIAVSLL